MTFKGAVVGCEPTAAGPRGLARWRKESASTMILGQIVCDISRDSDYDRNDLLSRKLCNFTWT